MARHMTMGGHMTRHMTRHENMGGHMMRHMTKERFTTRHMNRHEHIGGHMNIIMYRSLTVQAGPNRGPQSKQRYLHLHIHFGFWSGAAMATFFGALTVAREAQGANDVAPTHAPT